MNRIDVNNEPEAVKEFVRRLISKGERASLILEGRIVALVDVLGDGESVSFGRGETRGESWGESNSSGSGRITISGHSRSWGETSEDDSPRDDTK